MRVLEALEVLKRYCSNTSAEDCNERKCEIMNIIGDCVFSEVPEEWQLKEIE